MTAAPPPTPTPAPANGAPTPSPAPDVAGASRGQAVQGTTPPTVVGARATPGWPTMATGRRLDHAPDANESRGYVKPPGVDPEDIGLFVPRVVLTAPRLVFKLLFLPLQVLIEEGEKHKVAERTVDLLYNDARTAAILPTASFLTSYGLTFGLQAFDNNLGGHGEKASVSVLGGGMYSLAGQLQFQADRLFGSRAWVESRVLYERRPQMLFQGVGDEDEPSQAPGDPRATHLRTRFRENRFLALQRIGYTIGDEQTFQIGLLSIFNHRTFGSKQANDDPSIEKVYDTSQLPGFDNGATTLEIDANVVIDTRNNKGFASSGAYIEAFAGGVPRFREFGYFHQGLAMTGFFNLYRQTRVLVLRGVIEGVEGPTERIPFSELPQLGGPQRLRGYRLGRFRDEKAAVVTVEYLYPIHANISGALFVDAGRVGHSYDKLVSNLGDVRLGVGGGFLFHMADKSLFSIDIAYGDSINIFFTSNPLRAFYQRERQL